MSVVIFDIETYGHEENLSYKDFNYLKNRKGLESDEEVLEELSLNPFLSYVISVAHIKLPESELPEDDKVEIKVFYLTEEGEKSHQETITYMGKKYKVTYCPIIFNELRHEHMKDKERELLETFFKDIYDALYLVSYNGKYFDISFLRKSFTFSRFSFSFIFSFRLSRLSCS